MTLCHLFFFFPTSCWLKNDVAFYVAVVAYFCVIFVFNLIMFVVVLVQLCRIKRQNPHNSTHRTTMQDVRSVSGITILLGLTWGFAFFAWGPVNLPFMYLFAIFNSLQGQLAQSTPTRVCSFLRFAGEATTILRLMIHFKAMCYCVSCQSARSSVFRHTRLDLFF